MTSPTSTTGTGELEVLRGRQPGLRFPIGPGPVVLGNAPGPEGGIDLSAQEGDAPRRMSGRHAQIESAGGRLALRDLGSPGGTFVNRRPVPSGTSFPLSHGDVIQLGSVQLRVVEAGGQAAPPIAPRPTPVPSFSFAMRDGTLCRTWDDFLAISAQRWGALRDELTSGRLAGFLSGIGRSDLVPPADAPGTPDERLDAWIGRLPTTRPARPELEFHPRSLAVPASTGGGAVRRRVQISNSGHRILRTTARVEPAGTTWLRLVGPPAPLVTIDASELVVEIDLSAGSSERRSATIVIEGNGGEGRILVTVGPAEVREATPQTTAPRPSFGIGIGERVRGRSLTTRLAFAGLAAMIVRGLLAMGDRLIPATGPTPGLAGAAVVLGLSGLLLGLVVAARRGAIADLPWAGFAGGIAGALLAAVAVALGRFTDALTGPSMVLSALIWGVLGASAAILSLVPWPRAEKST